MYKFKIGDEVMLSHESRWVEEDSNESDSSNPLNMKGVITSVNDYGVIEYDITWSNDSSNGCYKDEDLIPAPKQQTQYECPYAVIEELEAHVETLEEALEKVTKELIELREKVNSGEFNSKEFKPISEMTMEDWRQALDEQWEFVAGKGITLSVTRIEEDQFIFPLRMSDGCTYRINGWYFNGNEAFDIIKRIK